MYSVTSKSSLEMVKIIRDKILNHTVFIRWDNTDCREPIGCRYVSLEINQTYTCKGIIAKMLSLIYFRQVRPEDGKALAEEWNCAFTEASARHNENVGRAFELIIGEVEKQNAPPAEEKGKCIIS